MAYEEPGEDVKSLMRQAARHGFHCDARHVHIEIDKLGAEVLRIVLDEAPTSLETTVREIDELAGGRPRKIVDEHFTASAKRRGPNLEAVRSLVTALTSCDGLKTVKADTPEMIALDWAIQRALHTNDPDSIVERIIELSPTKAHSEAFRSFHARLSLTSLAWQQAMVSKGHAERWFRATRTYRRGFLKVGRNDPCWCGSGKKYKLCCARP